MILLLLAKLSFELPNLNSVDRSVWTIKAEMLFLCQGEKVSFGSSFISALDFATVCLTFTWMNSWSMTAKGPATVENFTTFVTDEILGWVIISADYWLGCLLCLLNFIAIFLDSLWFLSFGERNFDRRKFFCIFQTWIHFLFFKIAVL